MSRPARAASHYLQTQVGSSSPLELVVLLYDAALRATSAARDAVARRDIRTRRDSVSRAIGIVGHLQSTLDLERGGSLAQELDRLYEWMTLRLLDATVQQDARPIEEVHRTLTTLRDGWHTIATRTPAETAP